ncbi:MAG TPA: DUF1622 domain-containing protein [Luteibacter sp.]|jgi:uncharacterized membrane protein|uniref:DUF1622 domain-containing protein n=1 Tax=Luteibacter sp. TaxID=1886636 RepID=UPI002F423839
MLPEDTVLSWIRYAALGIEAMATLLILVAITGATAKYLIGVATALHEQPVHYLRYKRSLGRALLLCLEILVAADIVRTIALDTTLVSVISLGLLVIIRTFLSWSLVLEVEGRWPWRAERPADAAAPPLP